MSYLGHHHQQQPPPPLAPLRTSMDPNRRHSLVPARTPTSATPSLPGKTKRVSRVDLACNRCRQKKRRCEGMQPCVTCEEDRVPCEFPSPRNKGFEAQSDDIIELFRSIPTMMETLMNKVDDLSCRLARVEQGAQPASQSLEHFTGVHHVMHSWPSVRRLLTQAEWPVEPRYPVEVLEGSSIIVGGSNRIPRPRDAGFRGFRYGQPDDSASDSSMMHGPSSTFKYAPHDRETVRTLVKSFVRHVFVVHPFLDLEFLEHIMHNFINRLLMPDTPDGVEVVSIPEAYGDDLPPRKRQRLHHGPESGDFRNVKTERRPHPLDDVLMLLVLALGDLCASSEKVEAQSAKAEENSEKSGPLPGWAAGSDTHPSPDSGLVTDGDVPGMTYFLRAMRELGPFFDGQGLLHAQIFLLAGLYKAKLGRAHECMRWMCMAGKAVQTLLERHKLVTGTSQNPAEDEIKNPHLASRKLKTPTPNFVVLAAWACISLESDILAEIAVPSSGIVALADRIPWPFHIPRIEAYRRLLSEDEAAQVGIVTGDVLLTSYSSLIWLRKQLNRIQRDIYGDGLTDESLDDITLAMQEHRARLRDWRNNLPEQLQWDDDDPPAPDILSARLRSKYWAALYVTLRPFLDYTLHVAPLVREGRRATAVLADSAEAAAYRRRPEVRVLSALQKLGRDEICEASEHCIQAAVQSTCAFDGLPHRMLVTNVHGIAHAQFGNVLVLSAIFSESKMPSLVTEPELRRLVDRTDAFLKSFERTSVICEVDRQILTCVSRALLGPE